MVGGLAGVAKAKMQSSSGGNSGGMTKQQFLAAHPILASLQGEDRRRFLKNHPGIAQAWARYQ